MDCKKKKNISLFYLISFSHKNKIQFGSTFTMLSNKQQQSSFLPYSHFRIEIQYMYLKSVIDEQKFQYIRIHCSEKEKKFYYKTFRIGDPSFFSAKVSIRKIFTAKIFLKWIQNNHTWFRCQLTAAIGVLKEFLTLKKVTYIKPSEK